MLSKQHALSSHCFLEIPGKPHSLRFWGATEHLPVNKTNKFWLLSWCVFVVNKSTDHGKPYSICFLYHNVKDNKRNLCQDDNWKLGLESARAALCKWATCTRQTVLSKTFANSLSMQKQNEQNVGEKSDDAYSLSIRVKTTLNHISICFLPQYQRQRKFFFRSASWKRHCRTRNNRGKRELNKQSGL